MKMRDRNSAYPVLRLSGYWGLLLGSVSVGLRWMASGNPEGVERLFSRGVFLFVRTLFDGLTSFLPFPSVYLLLVGAAWWMYRNIRKKKQPTGASGWRLLGHWALQTGNLAGWVIAWFFWAWGYNYYRIPVEQAMGLNVIPLDKQKIAADFDQETAMLSTLRSSAFFRDTLALAREDFPGDLERQLRQSLKEVLTRYGYPGYGRVRGRLLYPAGIFLRFSTAGLYLPFTGEGHIDPGLHPVQWPYVMAHELAHGYGFGDEGTCNFWAYLACIQSGDLAIEYAGRLGYWRYLASVYRKSDPQSFQRARDKLPPGIKNDLKAISEAMNRYPDLIPVLQYRVYDAYLKSQGISEGMLNYDRVLVLTHAWREKERLGPSE
ncbi:MAG: DUF3810 domain-containing protein [Haliscomenobacter sp.]|nr:DUF3810 domain-containing protein [Haliscomenobacter sp.]MBK8877609.1 DUF3810 domain-containing protein [Haliscomenobacter sp.]